MARSTAIPPPLAPHAQYSTTSNMADFLRRRALRSKLILIPSGLIVLYLLFHMYGPPPPSPHHSAAVGGWDGKGALPAKLVVDESALPGSGGKSEKAGEEEAGVFPHEKPYIDLTKLAIGEDLPSGAENIVLVIKTGGQVIWDKLPVHMTTTLTRAPNYLIYSDRADMVGRVQVHDVFYHMDPETVQRNADFEVYRSMVELKKEPQFLLAKEVMSGGGWKLDKYKNVPMLLDAWNRIPNKDWYFFVDDDTGIFWGGLVRYLDALDHTVPLYIGSQTLHKGELFAHCGSGYIVSRAAMEKAVARASETEVIKEFELVAENSCCGDHVVSRLLNATSTVLTWAGTKFNGRPWWERKFTRGVWCEEVFTYHHLGPEDVQQMYDYDLLMESKFRAGEYAKYPHRAKKHMGNKDYILHTDVYQAFLEPTLLRLLPSAKQWDNMAEDEALTGKVQLHGKEWEITSSPETCEAACKEKPSCVQWRYSMNKCDVNTKGFIMGRAASEKEKRGSKKEMVSGWIHERIEADRRSGKCERLD